MESVLLFGKVPLRPLPPEYRYAHSSLCLLDAVYSINAKYQSVRRDDGEGVIGRYCRSAGLEPFESTKTGEDTLTNLRSRLTDRGPELFAKEVLRNRSRGNVGGRVTSLKSEILAQLADWLTRQGVDGLDSLQKWSLRSHPDQVEFALKAEGIRGIGSTTLKYLMMLAGNSNQIKPDRHIKDFVSDIVHHPVGSDEATEVLKDEATRVGACPMEVDHSVWFYQRERSRESPRRKLTKGNRFGAS